LEESLFFIVFLERVHFSLLHYCASGAESV